jgi:hypothetical protein
LPKAPAAGLDLVEAVVRGGEQRRAIALSGVKTVVRDRSLRGAGRGHHDRHREGCDHKDGDGGKDRRQTSRATMVQLKPGDCVGSPF